MEDDSMRGLLTEIVTDYFEIITEPVVKMFDFSERLRGNRKSINKILGFILYILLGILGILLCLIYRIIINLGIPIFQMAFGLLVWTIPMGIMGFSLVSARNVYPVIAEFLNVAYPSYYFTGVSIFIFLFGFMALAVFGSFVGAKAVEDDYATNTEDSLFANPLVMYALYPVICCLKLVWIIPIGILLVLNPFGLFFFFHDQ